MSGRSQDEMREHILHPHFGKGYMPSKVSFYVWEAWHGRVITVDNLKRRDIQMQQGGRVDRTLANSL